jgi:hypothetical protein
MPNTEKLPQALNGEPVTADAIPAAVTAGTLRYDDGSVQIFNHDGSTTYTENGKPTHGEWYVDEDGRFCSFWPPAYRACYTLTWLAENGTATGLRFTEVNNGSRFDGRFQ